LLVGDAVFERAFLAGDLIVRRDRGLAISANDEYAGVLSLRRNSVVRPHKGDINFAKTRHADKAD